jgi:hypothetical protein
MSTLTLANLAGRKPRPVSKAAKIAFVIAIALGVLAFIIGALGDQPHVAWVALLVNYLVFTQFGIIGIVLGAIANITNSTWVRPLKRIAEAFSAFLPVSFVILIVLFIGRDNIWHWAEYLQFWEAGGLESATAVRPDFILAHDPEQIHGTHLAHAKAWWLNPTFFWARSFAIIIIFNLIALLYRRTSLRPDLGAIAELNGTKIAGWQGVEAEVNASQRRQLILAPIVGLLYAFLWSIHAFDFILSVDWTFPDAMMGAWQFASGILMIWCLLNLFGTYYRKNAYLDDLITKQQYHDLGKLMFGFSIFWAYLMWSQMLPIWYGNLPEETPFVVLRIYTEPWRSMSLVIPFLVWLIPFVVLMPASNKKKPMLSGAIALLILVGLWLERYTLIMPTLSPGVIPLGVVDLFVTLGFVGAFLFLTTNYLSKNPVLTITDPYLAPDDGHH